MEIDEQAGAARLRVGRVQPGPDRTAPAGDLQRLDPRKRRLWPAHGQRAAHSLLAGLGGRQGFDRRAADTGCEGDHQLRLVVQLEAVQADGGHA